MKLSVKWIASMSLEETVSVKDIEKVKQDLKDKTFINKFKEAFIEEMKEDDINVDNFHILNLELIDD